MLPITYKVPLMEVSEEKLERFGVSIDDITSYESFIDTTLRLHTKDRSIFINSYSAVMAGRSNGWLQEIVDYENNTLDLDVGSFERYMHFYRENYQFMINRVDELSTIDFVEAMAYEQGLLLYSDSYKGTVRMMYKGRDEDNILIFPLPNNNGSSTACVTTYAMISSSSKNMKNAWEFVKILMGEGFQKQISMFDYSFCDGVGVTSSLIDYNIDHYLEMNRDNEVDMNRIIDLIPNKYIDRMKYLYKNYDNVVISGLSGIEWEFYNGNEYLNDYIANTGDIDDLKKGLEQYYKIWFSE